MPILIKGSGGGGSSGGGVEYEEIKTSRVDGYAVTAYYSLGRVTKAAGTPAPPSSISLWKPGAIKIGVRDIYEIVLSMSADTTGGGVGAVGVGCVNTVTYSNGVMNLKHGPSYAGNTISFTPSMSVLLVNDPAATAIST